MRGEISTLTWLARRSRKTGRRRSETRFLTYVCRFSCYGSEGVVMIFPMLANLLLYLPPESRGLVLKKKKKKKKKGCMPPRTHRTLAWSLSFDNPFECLQHPVWIPALMPLLSLLLLSKLLPLPLLLLAPEVRLSLGLALVLYCMLLSAPGTLRHLWVRTSGTGISGPGTLCLLLVRKKDDEGMAGPGTIFHCHLWVMEAEAGISAPEDPLPPVRAVGMNSTPGIPSLPSVWPLEREGERAPNGNPNGTYIARTKCHPPVCAGVIEEEEKKKKKAKSNTLHRNLQDDIQ